MPGICPPRAAVLVAGKLKWTSYTAKDGSKKTSLAVLARLIKVFAPAVETSMTRPTTAPVVTATAVVPPYAGNGLLTPAQMQCARVRIALQELTALVQDLEACDVSVRQIACQALAAVVALQAHIEGKGMRQEFLSPEADELARLQALVEREATEPCAGSCRPRG